MWPNSGSEHVPQPDDEDLDDPGDASTAAEAVVPADGAPQLDLSSLPQVVGFEVTRILDAARIAGEQIRVQAMQEAQQARSEAVQARDDAARAHEEARLAREDADRARAEAVSVRGRVARLQAEFTGLLREMEPLSEPARPPAEVAEPAQMADAGTPDSPEPQASTWSLAWGITEGEGHGGDASHAGEPGPDGSDGEDEPADEGSTVVVPEAAVAGENEGDGPGGAPGSPEADAEGAGETPPTADLNEDAYDNVPVLERLRRLSPS
jgi:hypothetical protein